MIHGGSSGGNDSSDLLDAPKLSVWYGRGDISQFSMKSLIIQEIVQEPFFNDLLGVYGVIW